MAEEARQAQQVIPNDVTPDNAPPQARIVAQALQARVEALLAEVTAQTQEAQREEGLGY
jgi:hypothetical protein